REIGPNVHPLTPEIWSDNAYPIYHVSRVWIREHEAKVDVLRPMFEMGPGPDGKPIYQAVTVHLEGRFEPWHVVFGRSLEAGTVPTPAPYFLPEQDDPNQYRTWLRQQQVASNQPPATTTTPKTETQVAAEPSVTDATPAVPDAPVPPTPDSDKSPR